MSLLKKSVSSLTLWPQLWFLSPDSRKSMFIQTKKKKPFLFRFFFF